jgi:hypothetical protein
MPVHPSKRKDRDEDDYEEPKPRRAAARRDDDDDEDEDYRPRRAATKRRDDDDDDEDNRPRRTVKRPRDDDDDEDEAPRARRRPRDDDDDDDDRRPARRKARAADDDDDDDDAPRRSKRGADAAAKSSVRGGGWKGAAEVDEIGASYAKRVKLEQNEEILIKFLDDEPYASYAFHWLERKGKKSFTCLDDGCPLCDALGDRPRKQFCFNVVVMDPDTEPIVRSLDVGVRVKETLQRLGADPKNGPLSKPYFAVQRTGKGTKSNTQLTPVKERDVLDDWSVEPLSEKQLRSLAKQKYDTSIVETPTRKQLLEIVAEYTGDSEDDD